MKPALSSFLFILLSLFTCSACRELCARALKIPIDDVHRLVSVLAGKGTELMTLGPGFRRRIPSGTVAKWHNFSTIQRGAEYCLSYEELPGQEFCDDYDDSLYIDSYPETKFNLEPAHMISGYSYHYLLRLGFTLHDSPRKLLWQPGERAKGLELTLWGYGYNTITFNKTDSQLHYDLNFQRVSGDASCVVTSASLDVSRACRNNQEGIDSVIVEGVDDNGTPTPSYFSLGCDEDKGWKTVTTPIPGNNSTGLAVQLTMAVMCGIIFVLLLKAVFRLKSEVSKFC
ncbi:uncharacterized protein LOC122264724 [Penaeus japonicus]|uniref:uncharacterized protein LOC122264724 n=1 Tax=Penaeus japonicus TaxID=27405 RepID=UPI001C70DA90|nr:uncharacterized protein LOC122264724 [Penaeus japonicus]